MVLSNCSGKECWGTTVVLRKGREVVSKNTDVRISRHTPGTRFEAWIYCCIAQRKAQLSGEDSFLCATQERERQVCSNKSCEGVTCTCSGGENTRVRLVDTAG